MPLSDEDVSEILRIIDESPLQELSIETDRFSLHVLRGKPSTDAPEPADEAVQTREQVTIQAPMLGIFYRADGPGQEPFVELGSRVEPDTTVCIIEVMKMMNSVPAGVSGKVVEVCQENADVIEEGAPLFRVALEPRLAPVHE